MLRFGPLKPVGLRDPRTGKTPYAVVQLRNENADGNRLQSGRLSNAADVAGAARSVRQAARACANAEWLRLGVMHRNTFIDSPRLLDAHLQLRARPALYFAGQITGAEGYVEAAACGAIAGIARRARDAAASRRSTVPRRHRARRGRRAFAESRRRPTFQPANVTWAWFSALAPGRPTARQARAAPAAGRARARRAIDSLGALKPCLAPRRVLTTTSMNSIDDDLAVRRDGKLAMAGDGR